MCVIVKDTQLFELVQEKLQVTGLLTGVQTTFGAHLSSVGPFSIFATHFLLLLLLCLQFQRD